LNTPYVGPARVDQQTRWEDPEHPVKCVSKANGDVVWVTLDYAANRISGYSDMNLDEAREAIAKGNRYQTISFIYYIPTAHGDLLERE
jgi:hypothetical protein